MITNLLLGPEPPTDFETDGCTASPDRWCGVDLHEACRRHDWFYRFGGTTEQRREADLFFLINLLLLGCPLLLAVLYWLAVRLIGWRHWPTRKAR